MGGIYLSKGGQSFGPYTQAEIDSMRASGELIRGGYDWIWNESRAQWEPIERAPAPPPPPGRGQTPAQVAGPSAETTRENPMPAGSRLFHVPDETAQLLQAICYDRVSVLAGRIRKAGENGCDFVAESHGSGSAPLFMKDMPVRLNLLDPQSGATMSVDAWVAQAIRQNGRWSYRLSWEGCPEILLSAAA